MGKFSTMAIATSGLSAAQAGLYVTGHNMSNVDTPGFSRQQALQNDYFYRGIGNNGNGVIKYGLGTEVTEIRQIRNKFLDFSYREESKKLGYYEVKYNAGIHIDNIMGELESKYRTQSVIHDVWQSLQEINKHPEALETRGEFVSTCITFLDKVQNIYDRMVNYQQNLNDQVVKSVYEINTLAEKINKLNNLISKNEISGDHANDYRDQRNQALDDLSKLVDINYNEKADGTMDVYIESKELLVNGSVRKLGLRYTSTEYSFVEPIFTNERTIQPYDPLNEKSFPLYNFSGPVNSYYNNDKGSLKALLVTRGDHPIAYNQPVEPNPADYIGGVANLDYIKNKKIYDTREKFNSEYAVIPKILKDLDKMFNKLVTTINDAMAPQNHNSGTSPYALDGTSQFFEVFVRKDLDRYTGGVYNAENEKDYRTLYSINNVKINPDLLDANGYTKLCLSKTGDVGNYQVVEDILNSWKDDKFINHKGKTMSLDDYYGQFITNIGIEMNEAKKYAEEQEVLVIQVDNKRQEIKGVSLDEEMRNMMIYQHSYNACARVVNVVDSMLDKLINGTGRVGL